MNKFFFIGLLFTTINCFGQNNQKVSAFLSLQVNKTIYDRTITNNSGGIGFGTLINLNTKKKVKPILEVNADLFVGTKELYMTLDEKPINAKSTVMSVYAGPSFYARERIVIATTFGSAIYNGVVHFGVRPSIGFYALKNKKLIAKASFTNVFQQDDISDKSFAYFSFALAFKMF